MKNILPQENNILLPRPKVETFKGGTSTFSNLKTIEKISDLENWKEENISFILEKNLRVEEYILDIEGGRCEIIGGSSRALFYGGITLNHLFTQYGEKLPNLHVHDWPDLEIRGVMLDISRDKTPKLKTLFKIVDTLRDIKINHFQLYIEGYSFEYESFRELWEGKETPLTLEEIKLLENYCLERGIELAGNQNCFGHMDRWLQEKKYEELAENFEGVKVQGGLHISSGTTLNPLDPKSIELIEAIFDDIVPHFSSKLFNVNLDEPYELGTGKTLEAAKKIGVGQLYLDYSLKIYESMKKRNKQMMMWGDIIYKNPEIGKKFPKDIIMLEWGYSGYHPFDRHASFFRESGNRFILCSGTSSWGAITGRTESMIKNITNACSCAVKYGALGILNTEWGNCGHMQTPAMSYPGHILAGALSWNSAPLPTEGLERYLSLMVYGDRTLEAGKIIMDFGRYRAFEDVERETRTMAITSFERGIQDRDIVEEFHEIWDSLTPEEREEEKHLVLNETMKTLREFKPRELIDFVEVLYNRLKSLPIEKDDYRYTLSQYEVAKEIIVAGTLAREFLLKKKFLSQREKSLLLKDIHKKIESFIPKYIENWNMENKEGGLLRSLNHFYRLKSQVETELQAI